MHILWLLVGSLSFVFFIIFDFMGLYKKRGGFAVFIIGTLDIIAVSIYLLVISDIANVFINYTISAIIRAGFVLINLFMLIKVLFFSLPYKDTYIDYEYKTVDNGWYALCRHPGQIFFSLTYFGIYLLTLNKITFIAFVLFSSLNLLYVFIQDKYIFPKLLKGYDAYKTKTPFLIPDKESIKNMRETM